MKFEFFAGVKNLNELKKEYWKLAKKYHPDVNPEGSEQMKNINNEYEQAFAYIETHATAEQKKDNEKYYHSLDDRYQEIISKIINMPKEIIIEICGSWIWLSGNTKPYKDYIGSCGFIYNGKKKEWFWRPAEYKSKWWKGKKAMSKEWIRDNHGSEILKNKSFKPLKPAF